MVFSGRGATISRILSSNDFAVSKHEFKTSNLVHSGSPQLANEVPFFSKKKKKEKKLVVMFRFDAVVGGDPNNYKKSKKISLLHTT